MSTPVRIVVADDHNLFRAGLIELLESVAEFHVLGDVGTGAAALALLDDVQPDILMLDVEMPGPGAAAMLEQVAQRSPGTRVIVLTMHDDPDLVRSLLEAGAAGYLLKSAGRSELVAAINAATRADGSVLLAVSRATAIGLGRGPLQSDASGLSPRELEILSMVGEAKSSRDIARALYISEATVKRHLANAYSKLGASSRWEAVRIAEASGVLPRPARSRRRT